MPRTDGRLRAIADRRRRYRRWGVATGILVGALVASIARPVQPLLVWNVSPSAPVGLYAIGGLSYVEPGDMVLARVPTRWRRLAALRRYIPENVPLVKQVRGTAGDRVCASGRKVFIDGKRVAMRREFDGQGRPMPWWSGCVDLRSGAVFLLNASPDSFDGRYFGPSGRSDLIGEAWPLWTR